VFTILYHLNPIFIPLKSHWTTLHNHVFTMFCHINPIKFLLNRHYNPPWMTEATIPSPLHGSACPSPWTASCFASGGDMSTWRFLVIWCVWNSSPLECMSMCIMYIIYIITYKITAYTYIIYIHNYIYIYIHDYICLYNCIYIYIHFTYFGVPSL